jgi:chemotaxis signal transduction protein
MQTAIATPTLTETCMVLVFKIADRSLALPLGAIVKIVHSATLTQDIATSEFVTLDQQPVPVLNITAGLGREGNSTRTRLTAQTSPAQSSPAPISPFYIVTAYRDQWVAIGVNQPPTLMELPLSSIHPVPGTYRQAIGDMAQHMAVISQPTPLTLLLLDIGRAANLSGL